MSDVVEWKADLLPPRAADPSGTQTVWIDEERAEKNLIKSGDYTFITSNSKIAFVSVSFKPRSQLTSNASISAMCAHLLNLPKELSEHAINLALPSLKENQLAIATKICITLMPSVALNSATAPVLANFMSDMIPTLLMNTAVYTGCKIPINWYNQWNVLLITKVEGKQHQTREFQSGNSKINLEIPHFIAETTKIEILQWKDEFWHHELTLESSTNDDKSMAKPKSKPLKQWKDEISQVVGGLDHLISKITHLINFQLEFSNHALSSIGHNVLLYGPHGTGKSLLATQIAKTSGLQMFVINGPEIFQKLEGDSEVMLMNIFEKARANAPSILIFDDLNSVASSRKGEIGITEKRIVTQLIEELDKNCRFASKKVFVIGICTDLKDIDESLVKPNRFDMTLEVSVPNISQRLEILNGLSKKLEIVDKDEILQKISAEAHGFSGSELNNILQLAVLEASNINKEGVINEGKVVLQREHLLHAMNKIQPLSLVELNTDFKKISFEDIGGLGSVIEQVKKIIIEPLHNPAIFTRLGLKVPSGILLYGPPGTGKSMLVQAIATASGINFISIQGTELLSKYVGDTERLISKVFAKARASAPAILFIDQLEAISPKRTLTANSSDNRALSSLLIEMQGIAKDFNEQRLLVLGATNKPEGLDDAILRPGRFDYHIFIPPPDIQGRKDILKLKLEGIQHKLTPEEIEYLAYQTGGFSGADLENLIRETAMISLRENIDNAQIEKRHVLAAQEIIKGTLPGTITHPYNRQPPSNTGFVFNLK